MEHATAYSLILLVSVLPGIMWTYRHHRAEHRMQRGLRSYLHRAF